MSWHFVYLLLIDSCLAHNDITVLLRCTHLGTVWTRVGQLDQLH